LSDVYKNFSQISTELIMFPASDEHLS